MSGTEQESQQEIQKSLPEFKHDVSQPKLTESAEIQIPLSMYDEEHMEEVPNFDNLRLIQQTMETALTKSGQAVVTSATETIEAPQDVTEVVRTDTDEDSVSSVTSQRQESDDLTVEESLVLPQFVSSAEETRSQPVLN